MLRTSRPTRRYRGSFPSDRCNRCVWKFGAALTAMILGIAGPASIPFAAAFERPIVLTQLPVGTEAERTASSSGRMCPNDYGDGARIVVLSSQMSLRVLFEGFHSACDPEVSFDGKHLLFAGKKTAQDRWAIYEMAVDGSDVRQITHSDEHCRSPGYLSDFYQISDESVAWRQISFVSSRPGELNEYGPAAATSLYSCKLDGTGVHRLTYNLSSDSTPHLMWDGRLVYGSWQRRTLEHKLAGRMVLLGIHVDGTDSTPSGG